MKEDSRRKASHNSFNVLSEEDKTSGNIDNDHDMVAERIARRKVQIMIKVMVFPVLGVPLRHKSVTDNGPGLLIRPLPIHVSLYWVG